MDIPQLEAQLAIENKLVAAIAHRVCHSAEHNPGAGRLNGYCVVCGMPWPCETAKTFLVVTAQGEEDERTTTDNCS